MAPRATDTTTLTSDVCPVNSGVLVAVEVPLYVTVIPELGGVLVWTV